MISKKKLNSRFYYSYRSQNYIDTLISIIIEVLCILKLKYSFTKLLNYEQCFNIDKMLYGLKIYILNSE